MPWASVVCVVTSLGFVGHLRMVVSLISIVVLLFAIHSHFPSYVEAIFRMLKPGGVWVNLGPLLYHWAVAADAHVDKEEDPRYRQSVEVTMQGSCILNTHLCYYITILLYYYVTMLS